MANSIFITNFLGLPISVAGTTATITGNLALTGNFTPTGIVSLANGTLGAPTLSWTDQPTAGWFKAAADDVRYVNSVGTVEVRQVINFLILKTGSFLSWTTTDAAGTVDTSLSRAAAGYVNATTGFAAGSTQGVATFGPAGVTSITVKGGLVVAIS